MKKLLILTVMCVGLLSLESAFSQNMQGAIKKAGTLMVLIDGFPSDKGDARIALCNSIESYENDERALMQGAARINNGKAEWAFRDLPFGEYAIKVFHDENGNKKLDKNLFGAPTEAYGFSNNARGTFGPPDYKKAAFTFDKTDRMVRITVK